MPPAQCELVAAPDLIAVQWLVEAAPGLTAL